MKLYHLLCLAGLFLVMACEKETITPPLVLEGVDTHYKIKGEIEGRNFEFFQGANERYIVIGHRAYLKSWETVFERSTSTDTDGYFRLLYQFPIETHTLDAIKSGELIRTADGCRWRVEVGIQDATNQIIKYGCDSRDWQIALDFERGNIVPQAPEVLKRGPVLIDEGGKPYFDVDLKFRTILRTLDEKQRQAPLVAEGRFRVYLCQEDEER